MSDFRVFQAIPTESKKRKRKLRQVSSTPKFRSDLENYRNRSSVISKLEEIAEHLKNKKDLHLEILHNDHELTKGKLSGYRSLSLYPGEYGDRDIVVVYKIHRNDHVALYHIGNHAYVYDSDKNP